MRIFKKVNANLAVFSFYLPSLVCFAVVLIGDAWVNDPPQSIRQWVHAVMLTLFVAFLVTVNVIEIFNVRHGKYSPSQIKKVIRIESFISLVFPAADALGMITINHSWWAIVPIIDIIYGIYVVMGVYKNNLVPEGFIVKDKEQ